MPSPRHRPPIQEPGQTWLVLKNVDFNASEWELNSFIVRKDLALPTEVRFHRHKYGEHAGRRSGVAFVSFARATDATMAFRLLHGERFNWRILWAEFCEDRPRQTLVRRRSEDQAEEELSREVRGPLVGPAAQVINRSVVETETPAPSSFRGSTLQLQVLAPKTESSPLSSLPATPILENSVPAADSADLPFTPIPWPEILQRTASVNGLGPLDLELANLLKTFQHIDGTQEWLDLEKELEDLKAARRDHTTFMSLDLPDDVKIKSFEWNESLDRKIAYLDLEVLEKALTLDFSRGYGTENDRGEVKRELLVRKKTLDQYCQELAWNKGVRALKELKASADCGKAAWGKVELKGRLIATGVPKAT